MTEQVLLGTGIFEWYPIERKSGHKHAMLWNDKGENIFLENTQQFVGKEGTLSVKISKIGEFGSELAKLGEELILGKGWLFTSADSYIANKILDKIAKVGVEPSDEQKRIDPDNWISEDICYKIRFHEVELYFKEETYKCPYCYIWDTRHGLETHIDINHPEDKGENFEVEVKNFDVSEPYLMLYAKPNPKELEQFETGFLPKFLSYPIPVGLSEDSEDMVECNYCKVYYKESELDRQGLCKNDTGACNIDHVCNPKGITCGWKVEN